MASEAKREVRRAEPLTSYELVFPGDMNARGTMFGGKVVAMMDKAAGMCVGRWANRLVVTASIDAIQFEAPIQQGQMIEAAARVLYVGRTSCVVRVAVTAHDLQSGARVRCCAGYFNMVGLDSDGRPTPLPLIPVESEEEQRDWEAGRAVHEAMLARRKRQ